MDAIDLRLLDLLRLNARVSGAELARQVGLSPPAVHERVAKLEQSNIIRGYRADISPEAVGLGITAIVGVVPSGRADGAALVAAMSEIAEIDTCLFVAGEESYMLQVRVASMGDLERLIVRIGNLPGVERTRTTIALSVKWEDRPPPAPAPRRRATDQADGDGRRATDRADGDGRVATDRADNEGRRATDPAGDERR